MDISQQVWILKYQPRTLDDLILPEKDKEFFKKLTRIPSNLLFLGKAGCGKTSLAKILSEKFAPNGTLYVQVTQESGVDTVRENISDFTSVVSIDENDKIVILNEVDLFSNAAQGSLKGAMEDSLDDVRFILTSNFKHKITDEIRSRCQIFEFNPPFNDVVKRVVSILKQENIKVPKNQKNNLITLIKVNYPDIRATINELQKSCIT